MQEELGYMRIAAHGVKLWLRRREKNSTIPRKKGGRSRSWASIGAFFLYNGIFEDCQAFRGQDVSMIPKAEGFRHGKLSRTLLQQVSKTLSRHLIIEEQGGICSRQTPRCKDFGDETAAFLHSTQYYASSNDNSDGDGPLLTSDHNATNLLVSDFRHLPVYSQNPAVRDITLGCWR